VTPCNNHSNWISPGTSKKGRFSHRITECSGLEGTSVGPSPCRSRVTQRRLHRTLSRRVWNISREADSTTSLGSLCQCSVTLRGKKFFLMVRRNFLSFQFFPCTWLLGCRRARLHGRAAAPVLQLLMLRRIVPGRSRRQLPGCAHGWCPLAAIPLRAPGAEQGPHAAGADKRSPSPEQVGEFYFLFYCTTFWLTQFYFSGKKREEEEEIIF